MKNWELKLLAVSVVISIFTIIMGYFVAVDTSPKISDYKSQDCVTYYNSDIGNELTNCNVPVIRGVTLLFTTKVELAMTCPVPKLINQSKEPWNKNDAIAKNVAKERCSPVTNKRSPCLKQFIKQKPKTYRAICGKA